MLEIGRYEGEIRAFELWDPTRTNRKAGFYFSTTCEWIDREWISVCLKCKNFRCLVVDPVKQEWYCRKCNRKGTFKKPEEKSEKKTDKEKGMISQKRFFETLFEHAKGYIEIRAIDREGKVKQSWYEIEEIGRLLYELKKPYYLRTNIYFGVCVRDSQEGKEKNVKQVNCFWVDIDAKDIKGKEAIKKKLEAFKPEPSIIVSSGNGYHCYWLLDKPEIINSQEDIDRLKGYNKGLAEELRADKTFDLSRVLRVPDTKNFKDPENILKVKIIKSSPELRYSLKSLSRFFRKIEQPGIKELELDKESLDIIPDRFWKILDENTKIRNTWKGERPDLKDKTKSGYDMSLASLLMPYNFKDNELLAILRESPSGKGKKGSLAYLKLTIGKAKAEYKKRKDKEQLSRAKANVKSQGPGKQEKKKKERIFITGRQLVEEEIKELPAPIGKGFFVPERYTILAASDGEGKTLFCTQLALSAITGTTFLDFFPIPKPVKVLYFCGENSRGDIKAKIEFQKIEIEKILERDITEELEKNFILVEPININFWLNLKDKTELHNWLEEIKPDIVIFDPLADFISSERSLSDDRLARGTVKVLTKIAQEYKCFPILTTHLKKEAINPQTGRSIVTLDNVWSFVFGSRYWLASAAAQIIMIRANLQRYPKAKNLVFKFKTVTEVKPLQIMRNKNLFYQELPPDKMSLASLTAEDVKDVLQRRCKGQQVEAIIIDAITKDFGCSKTIAGQLLKTALKTKLLYKDKDNLIKVSLTQQKELKL